MPSTMRILTAYRAAVRASRTAGRRGCPALVAECVPRGGTFQALLIACACILLPGHWIHPSTARRPLGIAFAELPHGRRERAQRGGDMGCGDVHPSIVQDSLLLCRNAAASSSFDRHHRLWFQAGGWKMPIPNAEFELSSLAGGNRTHAAAGDIVHAVTGAVTETELVSKASMLASPLVRGPDGVLQNLPRGIG